MEVTELYSLEILSSAKEFWYEFDRYTLFDPTIMQKYLECNLFKINPLNQRPSPNLDWMFFSLRHKLRTNPQNYGELFLEEISSFREGIKKRSQEQISKINGHLKDFEEIQQAFELFGQGVLFDERTGKVHKMDGKFPQDLVGYRRWHGFLRAAVAVGENNEFWLNLDRSLLLAYLIQSNLMPLDTKKDNPFMDEQRLLEYKSSCLLLELRDLDEAFTYYFP